MRKMMLAIAMAATALPMAPAPAQVWRLQPSIDRQIRADINQLENRIRRAQQRRAISPREARSLRRDARDVRQLHHRYARNGLNRWEVGDLETRINRLHQRLRFERRDWDGRPG